jgi:hypothetical protein
MAGNEIQFRVDSHLIIGKTNPVIHPSLPRNTFRARFTLDSIITIEDEHLNNLVCTITDSYGVQDWYLDLPLEVEGKKRYT